MGKTRGFQPQGAVKPVEKNGPPTGPTIADRLAERRKHGISMEEFSRQVAEKDATPAEQTLRGQTLTVAETHNYEATLAKRRADMIREKAEQAKEQERSVSKKRKRSKKEKKKGKKKRKKEESSDSDSDSSDSDSDSDSDSSDSDDKKKKKKKKSKKSKKKSKKSKKEDRGAKENENFKVSNFLKASDSDSDSI